jgi:drug/metabolite transporter (DMT)-like permease
LTAGLAARQDCKTVYMIYLQAVLALIADVVIWRIIPDIVSCIGSLLIIAALVITERSKEEEEEEEDLADFEMRFPNRLS